MKMKPILLAFLLIACFPLQLFAQQVKVLDVSGEVLVKQDPAKNWEKLKVKTSLNKDAELQTKQNAYCTLAFDRAGKNIVTVKENSQIKIESVEPGFIFMPKGRVLSQVSNIAPGQKFQVRTPTAVAGARGTGWGTGTDGINSSAQCFENTIYIQGLDEQGNVTGEQDISSGMGISIGRGGALGESSPLGDSDYSEWNDFSGYTNDIGGGQNGAGGNAGAGGGDTLEDLRQDQRNDQHNNSGEDSRTEQEKFKDSGDNSGGTQPSPPTGFEVEG